MKRFRRTALALLGAAMALSSCGSDVAIAPEISEAVGCGSSTNLPNKFQFVPDFQHAVVEPAPADAIPTIPIEQAQAMVAVDYGTRLPVNPRLVLLTVPPTPGHEETAIDHRLTWALAYPFPEPQQMFISGPTGGPDPSTDCVADEQIIYVDATQPQETWTFGATEYHHSATPPA